MVNEHTIQMYLKIQPLSISFYTEEWLFFPSFRYNMDT